MSVWLDPLRETRPIALDRQPAGWGEYLGTVIDEMAAETTRTIASQTARNQAEIEARAFGGPELTELFGADNVAPPLVPQSEVNDRVKRLGLSFDRPMTAFSLQSIIGERERQLEADFIYRRAREGGDYGTAKWLAAGGLELLLTATDPTNIASAFIPAMGPARFAQLAARVGTGRARLIAGTLEGAFGALAVEPIYASAKRESDPDYGLADSLINIAFGGAIGGGLHWLGGRIGDAFERRTEARATQRVVAALQTIGSGDEPRTRQAMAEALERVRPETREAVLRAAIGQLGADRRVDVEAILRTDPDWRPPRITAEQRGRLESPQRLADRVDRPTLEAASRDIATAAAETLRGAFTPAPVPDGFRPTVDQLAEARRIQRGLAPLPETRQGQSLAAWVRKVGGLDSESPEAGELRAQDLGPRSFLTQRKRYAGVSTDRVAGHSADDLARRATEEGFYPRERASGESVELNTFITDLIADAQGARRLYREDDVDAIRAAETRAYNEGVQQLLSELGLDVRRLEPRTLAWLLSLDEGRQRREALARRVDNLSEAETVEALDMLDREIADAMLAEEDAARAALAERGPIEQDADLAHRERTQQPLTLDDLERLHADAERLASPREPAGGPAGDTVDAGRGADEPGQRAGDGQPAQAAAAAPAGLRPEDGSAGAGRTVRAEGEPGPVQAGLDRPPADGAQAVVPGAERITDRELAERRLQQPLRGGSEAPPAGGLFDADARAQSDLFDASPPLTTDDIDTHVVRQSSPESDLHADFEAVRAAEADAATKAATPEDDLQAFMARYGDQLSDQERDELDAVAKTFDDQAAAIEALAACQVGGA